MLNSYEEAKQVELAHHGEGGYLKNWVQFHRVYREDELATKGGTIALDSRPRAEIARYIEQHGAREEESRVDDRIVRVLRVPAAGRTVMHALEYVSITIPGDKTNIIDRKATEEDKERYAKQYEAFLQGTDQNLASGTLLTAAGIVPQERAEEYRAMKVITVEQLAGMSDSNLQVMGPGARAERERANEFLKTAAGYAPVAELRNELERERARSDAALERLAAAETALRAIGALKPAQLSPSSGFVPAPVYQPRQQEQAEEQHHTAPSTAAKSSRRKGGRPEAA